MFGFGNYSGVRVCTLDIRSVHIGLGWHVIFFPHLPASTASHRVAVYPNSAQVRLFPQHPRGWQGIQTVLKFACF